MLSTLRPPLHSGYISSRWEDARVAYRDRNGRRMLADPRVRGGIGFGYFVTRQLAMKGRKVMADSRRELRYTGPIDNIPLPRFSALANVGREISPG